MKHLNIILALLVLPLMAQAINRKDLKTYTSSLQGKKGEALKTAVFNIIKLEKAPISYDGLWNAYKTTDKRSDGYLRDWYSNSTSYVIGGPKQGANYQKEGDSYNREHLVPQSWFKKASPMVSDIVQVVPTDGWINNQRGDLYLAEVGTADYTSNNGYCKRGTCKTPGYSGTVFEPNDEIKGDIARIYFYMATCYQNKITNWGGGLFTGTTYQPFASWYFTMLMRWAKNDALDDVEIARNNAVDSKQGNRNLFVDFPYLAEYIWGDSVDVAFNPQTSITTASDDNRYTGHDVPVYVVADPVFSPAGGTYSTAQTVTISCSTSGVTIFYTTDGSDPTTNGTEYTSAITVSESMTIKAVAIDGDGKKSNVITAVYVINDNPNPGGTEIFVETFDLCVGVGGNTGGFTDASATFKPDNDGWSAQSSFGGDKCARFGSSSKSGVATTPSFFIDGETTFSFKAAPYGTDGTSLKLSVSGNAELSQTSLTMKAGEWTTYTLTLTGSGSVTVTFTPTKRFFLDDVCVTSVTSPILLPGDVNKDGSISLGDVMALVDIILNEIQSSTEYDLVAADLDGDGQRSLTDIMLLVAIILEQ